MWKELYKKYRRNIFKLAEENKIIKNSICEKFV